MMISHTFLLFLTLISLTTSSWINGHLEWFLMEELPADIRIGNVAVDSPLQENITEDALPFVRYVFLSGENTREDLFTIDPSTSIIQTAEQIDRDADSLCAGIDLCIVWLQVAAVVPSGMGETPVVDIRVEIVDTNDNSPSWMSNDDRQLLGNGEEESVALSIPENAAVGSRFHLPSCVDLDGGVNGIQRYELANNQGEHFEIIVEHNNGVDEVFLTVSKSLDREQEEFYSLTVTAFDGGSEPRYASLVILITILDENDNTPTFDRSSYDITVPEHATSGGMIAMLNAVDLDSGVRGQIHYSMMANEQATQLFSINENTGHISTKIPLDFEEGAMYVLEVEASDGGTPPRIGHASVIIRVEDINDNSPLIQVNTLTGLDEAHVSEAATEGVAVAQLYVSDPDGGDNGRVQCEISDPHFRLESIEGLQYRIATTSIGLNREEQELYDVTITCQDGGTPRRDETLQLRIRVLDINDNAPRFTQRLYQSLVDLETEDEAWSVIVHASDADAGPNAVVRYEVHAEVRHMFMAEPHTGEIMAAPLTDIRDTIGMEFRVLAYDMGFPRQTSTATVAILEANNQNLAQLFDHRSFAFGVYENKPLGTEAGVLTVFSDNLEEDLEFSLDESTEADSFAIEPLTGRITTRVILDRELQAVYYFKAFAATSTSVHTSTTSVTIYVADTNDQGPVFVYPTPYNNTITWSAMEHPLSEQGSRHLARVMAIDNDLGDNSMISYYLEPMEMQSFNGISMDTNTGDITVSDYFWDTETGTEALYAGQLTLVVKASDHGYPPLDNRQLLHINLQSFLPPQNDNNRFQSSTPVAISDDNDDATQLSKADATLVIALTAAALLVIFLVVFAIMMFLVYRRATGKEVPIVASDFTCCCWGCQKNSSLCNRKRKEMNTSQCPVINQHHSPTNSEKDGYKYNPNILQTPHHQSINQQYSEPGGSTQRSNNSERSCINGEPTGTTDRVLLNKINSNDSITLSPESKENLLNTEYYYSEDFHMSNQSKVSMA